MGFVDPPLVDDDEMRVPVHRHPFGNKISVINIHYFMMATISLLQFFAAAAPLPRGRVVNRVHICNFAAALPAMGVNFLIKP